MKYLNLIIGGTLLLLNLAIGLLLSAYAAHSLIITSVIIAATTALNHLSSNLSIKDGFKVALPFFFSFLGLIEYVLGFFVEKALVNDYYLIGIIALFAIQVITLVTVYIVSHNN